MIHDEIGPAFADQLCCMKKGLNYKALYLACAKQSADKDRLIALQQQQLTLVADERQQLQAIISELHLQVVAYKVQLHEQQALQEQQQQAILAQAEKLTQQQSILQQQDDLLTEQQKQIHQHKQDVGRLTNQRYELITLKKWIYGIKSEKRHQPSAEQKPVPGSQLQLAIETDSWGICKITDRRRVPAHLRVVKTTIPQKCGGRHDFPPGLPEEIILIDVPGKPAGARCVGHVDQRQLACDPMRWYIKVNRRLVYLVPKDEEALYYQQLIAPLPAHPVQKCKMDISILVMLTIEKFLYHMPVWRQQQRLRQYGIDLSYSTLCSLVNRTCEALEPLWHLLLKEITHSGLVNMDETRYRVLDNSKKLGKKSHVGWMWALMNPMQGIAGFLYQKGRGKKDIHAVLQGYKGYLMTDAYGAYTQYGKQRGVTHQHCLSHARRYFVYALTNDAIRAGYALDQFFSPLYGIEQDCKRLNLDYDAITARRQTEALPVLQALREWLVAELPKTTPRTPIHKAISYTLNNYSALVKYTSDGMLPIDNNQLEGQIRSIALGRHNHMFAGSHRGGELAAIIYSFMASCKLQKIDPAKWLDDVLRRIADQPDEKLLDLLPQYWKPLKTEKACSA